MSEGGAFGQNHKLASKGVGCRSNSIRPGGEIVENCLDILFAADFSFTMLQIARDFTTSVYLKELIALYSEIG